MPNGPIIFKENKRRYTLYTLGGATIGLQISNLRSTNNNKK